MHKIFHKLFFSNSILIENGEGWDTFDSRFILANRFNIRITEGKRYINENIVAFVCEMMAEEQLKGTRDIQLQADKFSTSVLPHNGTAKEDECGDDNTTDDAVTSFIDEIHESALNKNAGVKNFVIISEEEAEARLREKVEELLNDGREYNKFKYAVLKEYVTEYGNGIDCRVDKDTVIKLLIETRNVAFAKFLKLGDVVEFVYKLNAAVNPDCHMRTHLNFTNRDRKFITAVINCTLEDLDQIFGAFKSCNSNQKKWQIILRNIHYKPVLVRERLFFKYIHLKHNTRTYSRLEENMQNKDYYMAAMTLYVCGGSDALEKNLNYIVSRCENEEEIFAVVNVFKDTDGKRLIKMRMKYQNYKCTTFPRTFVYWRDNVRFVHTETRAEVERRKSALTPEKLQILKEALDRRINRIFKDKYAVSSAYISPNMYKVALPLDETPMDESRYFLPRGSRVKLNVGTTLRAAAEWSGVRNIDFNINVIDAYGIELFFGNSNRMKNEKYSFVEYAEQIGEDGHSGRKYYDFNPENIKNKYYDARYVLFSSAMPEEYRYSKISCHAGCGTVTSDDFNAQPLTESLTNTYRVSAECSRAIFFAIDLNTYELIWINSRDRLSLAKIEAVELIKRFDNDLSVMSLGKLFEIMSRKLTNKPVFADYVITDNDALEVEGDTAVVKPSDYSAVLDLMDKICSHELC